MNPKIIRKLHRWIGLIFSVSVLMASGSGVIHNVMTRTQAPPPKTAPTGDGIDTSAVTVGVAEAVGSLEGDESPVLAVNLRRIGEAPWYQIYRKSAPVPSYVNAAAGTVDATQDEAYAAQIASRFLGGAEVTKTDYLTRFNAEYIGIFRILPVYRFDTDDEKGTRVYVSTTTGSVTRHTDDRKQFEANIFSNFHKLAFIRNKDLRDLVLTTLTSATFLTACLGIALFFTTRPKKKKTK